MPEDLDRGARVKGAPEPPCPRILVISCDVAQMRVFERICAVSSWAASDARDLREAIFALSRYGIDVILSDDRLPDGTWKDVLSVVAPMAESPKVVVLFDDASAAQWSEVLNLGGFDVLNRPLDEADVAGTVAAALRSLQDEAQERRRMKGAPIVSNQSASVTRGPRR